MATSEIHIRPIEPKDFNRVTDLYHRFLASDFAVSCGRRVFLSYLQTLYASPQGSVWCAVTEEGRVIGFTVGIIDRERFNRQWLWRNLWWLGPLVIAKFFLSSKFRSLLLARLQAKLRGPGKGVPIVSGTSASRLKSGQAIALWVAVDESFRGEGKDVASRLITSRNQDLKSRGIAQVYGFIARTNLANIFIHLKNGWEILPMDDNRYLVVKDL